MLDTNLHDLSYETLDAIRSVAAQNDGVFNGFVQPPAVPLENLPQGIQFFDFDTVGRDLVLEVTPLTNKLPRRGPVGGTAMHWREIISINKFKQTMGVAEGLRGGRIEMETRDRMSKFAGLGLENVNTFESMYAARGVANPREMARLQTLKAVRMGEEPINLYGNASVQLGTPAQPVGVAAATGAGETSTMTARTVSIRVVALTGEGRDLSSVASGVVQEITRTNADGSTTTFGGGSSNVSPASVGVAMTANQKLTATVADVPGALGYAWYIGTAGNERLALITSINQAVFYKNESGTAQLASAITADKSTNAYEYDGVFTTIVKSGSGSFIKNLNSAGLTADSTGNIAEFIEAFLHAFESWYLSYDEIVVSPIEAYEITKILLNGPAKDIYAANLKSNSNVHGGFYVSAVLNPFTGKQVPITVHPFLPPGTILLLTWDIPYPIPKLGRIWEVVMRQPYYSIDWPRRTRQDEVGVYLDQGLKCEMPVVQGVIKNVKSVSLRQHNSLLV